jgi:hypothetical protein
MIRDMIDDDDNDDTTTTVVTKPLSTVQHNQPYIAASKHWDEGHNHSHHHIHQDRWR